MGRSTGLLTTGAAEAVESGIENAQDLAGTAYGDLSKLLNEVDMAIGNLLGGVSIDTDVTVDPPNAVGFDKPGDGGLDYALVGGTLTNKPTYSGGSVSVGTPDTPPEFAGKDPDLRYVAPPSKPNIPVPVAEALPDRSGQTPVKPDAEMPDAPILRDLVLPPAPTIEVPTFTGVLPGELEDFAGTEFSFEESIYDSSLLRLLNDKLADHVNNLQSTGLRPEIEQQIWDRSRERVNAVMRDAITQVRRLNSAAGWDQPTGDLYESIHQAEQKAQDESIAESRNVAVEQAKLELQNYQFAFTQALNWEGKLIDNANNINNRALQAAKYAVDAAISIYQMYVEQYKARVTLYGTMAEVYAKQIQAEVTRVELYKAELEGQKIIGELNVQDVQRYGAEVNAVETQYEAYKTEVEAFTSLLQQDALKIQQFESEVKIYAEKVKAKNLEYEGYKAELSGEQIKSQIYGSMVDAYSARVNSYKVLSDTKLGYLGAEIKVNKELPIEVYKADIQAYSAKISAQVDHIKASAEVLKAKVDKYRADIEGATAEIEANVKIEQLNVEASKANAEVSIEKYKADVQLAIEKAKAALAALENAARVQAQVVAGYASGVNYSASISDSYSGSNSLTTSRSTSFSDSHSTIISGTL